MKISAIIPAAGSGSRYDKNRNKLLETVKGIPVIVMSLQKISASNVENITICTSESLIEEIWSLVKEFNLSKVKKIIIGGDTRQESVYIGLKTINEEKPDFVLIHDAARPLISTEIINNAINEAKNKGAVIVAVPAKDTIKRVDKSTNKIIETLNREELWNVQTPQIFRFDDLIKAHEKFKNTSFTDDAALLESSGIDIFTVMGSYSNIKITTQEDIAFANILINNQSF